jgi:hypothetical protein
MCKRDVGREGLCGWGGMGGGGGGGVFGFVAFYTLQSIGLPKMPINSAHTMTTHHKRMESPSDSPLICNLENS